MQALLEAILDIIPTSSIFEISFGLIISVVMFLIDRRGKERQEETLKRQDESLDIILEQVSKVNIFQTKTLSLAIESLGKDLEYFNKEIFELRSLISSNYVGNKIDEGEIQEVIDQSSINTPPISHSLSTTDFGAILSNQINSFVNNIKNNISNLTKIKDQQSKDIYKLKKEFEYDIKDLSKIQSMVADIDSSKDKSRDKNSFNNQSVHEDFLNDDKDLEKSSYPEENLEINQKEKNITNSKTQDSDKLKRKTINFDEFNLELDKLKSIPELIKLTESIINTFENEKSDLKKQTKIRSSSEKNNIEHQIKKKKIKPTSTLSREEFEKEK